MIGLPVDLAVLLVVRLRHDRLVCNLFLLTRPFTGAVGLQHLCQRVLTWQVLTESTIVGSCAWIEQEVFTLVSDNRLAQIYWFLFR